MLTPADDDLLHDLLDGRLAGAQAERARARLTAEPQLREAYDELLRAREILRTLPAPEPPVDFTARVRARLDAEAAMDVEAGPATDAAPLTETSRDAWRPTAPSPAPALPPSIPLAWRRVVLVAYAMAALLVVAIGVLSLQRGAERASPSVESAAVPAAERDAARAREAVREPGWRADDALLGMQGGREGADKALGDGALGDGAKGEEAKGDKAKADGAAGPQAAEVAQAGLDAKQAPLRTGLAGGMAAPPGAPVPEAARGSAEVAERGAPPKPRLGAGGAVQPGLRVPTDAAPSAPAPAPAPPRVAQPAPGAPLDARAPQAGPALAAAPAARMVLPDVLLLEAESAEVGRRLLDEALQGPRLGAAPGSAAPAEAAPAAKDAAERGRAAGEGRVADAEKGGFRSVRLRRAEVDADRALLVRLGLLGAAPARGLPGGAPGAGGGGGGEAAPAAVVLADFSRALSAEQQARLEALLGPLPAGATTPSTAAPAAAPTAAPAAAPAPSTPPSAPPTAGAAMPGAPPTAGAATPGALPTAGAAPARAPATRPTRLVRFVVLAPVADAPR